MIRDIPNRYEKLNFSSDDIQNQMETHSQDNPIVINTNLSINPILSKQVITRQSASILNSQESLPNSSVKSSSSGTSSPSSSRSSSNSSRNKSLDHLEEQDYDGNNVNREKQGQKNKLKYQKLKIVSLPSQLSNPNSIKESLLKPITLFNTKNQYYIQSNSETFRKRRLLSFQGEETGEFRELVTFLDKVQQNKELPTNKMIRKNSCCCMNCGPKSQRQVKLDKLIPKFKPTEVIRNMYKKKFQTTINNVSKMNKFFRSKLQIRTKNNNNLVFGEKKASPTKFTNQSAFKISPKSLKLRESPLQLESTTQKQQQPQPLFRSNVQLQQQISSPLLSQQDTPNSIPNNTIDMKNKRKHTLMTRNSLFLYSDGEQHQQFIAKLQQLPASPFKKSVFNIDSSRVTPHQDQQAQSELNKVGETNNINDKINLTKQQSFQQSSSPLLQQLVKTGSNPNTPLFTKSQKPLQLQLEQMKNKQASPSLVVEDKIIDQFRLETKMGNINNDFVKSVGSNILRQSLSNLPRDVDIDSERQKSKRTDIIPEDMSEQAQQNDKSDNRSRFISSYYRHVPKFSNKYLNPVLQQIKRDPIINSGTDSIIFQQKNNDFNSEFSLDKKQIKKNISQIQLNSRTTTTFISEMDRENILSKNYKALKSQSNIFNITNQQSLKSNKSLQNLNQYNSFNTLTSQNNEPSIFKSQSDCKKNLRMKRNLKGSIFAQPDSAYLRESNNSSMNILYRRQQSQMQPRPPFILSNQNQSTIVHAFSLFPQKYVSVQTLNHIPKITSSKFSTKSSLPDISQATPTQYEQRNHSQKKLSTKNQLKEIQLQDKQNSDSIILLPTSLSQPINSQSKGDYSPSKKQNKIKRKMKSKSNTQSKILLQFQDIYRINQKQSN